MKKILLILCLVSTPYLVSASAIGVVTDIPKLGVGEVAHIRVTLDPEGDTLNALEGTIVTSNELSIESVSLDSSIISFWVVSPHVVDGHRVEFAGIIPGGYQGELSPNWNGYREGTLMTLVVRGVQDGSGQVILDSKTELYRNDGEGTRVPYHTAPADIRVSGVAESTQITPDTVVPEAFTPELVSDPALYDGAWSVAWNAKDNEGMLHASIAESHSWYIPRAFLSWRDAVSPARLNDQGRTSVVYVRVVDEAGNEHIETIYPDHASFTDVFVTSALLIGILCVFALLRRVQITRRS